MFAINFKNKMYLLKNMEEILYIVTLECLKFLDIKKLFPKIVFAFMFYRIPNTDKVEITAFTEF